MSRMIACVVAVLVLAMAAPMARADLIEFTFGGELSQIIGEVPDPWSGIVLGTGFDVRYVFDSEAPDLDDSSAFGTYDAILSYTVTLDGVSLTTHESLIEIELIGIPRYFARFDELPIGAGAVGSVHLSGFGVLEDDSLPTDMDLEEWDGMLFEFGNDDFEVYGTIDSFSRRVVPSPGALVIVLLTTLSLPSRKRKC